MTVLFMTAFVIVLDQITKVLVRSKMDIYESIPVIQDFFHLTYVTNNGMAFGINFNGGIYVFTAASFIMTILLLVYLWTERKSSYVLRSALALILGGAIGNLIDRVIFREVADFFDFIFGTYHWYIFNVADSAVTVGMVLFLYYSFFLQPKPESPPQSA